MHRKRRDCIIHCSIAVAVKGILLRQSRPRFTQIMRRFVFPNSGNAIQMIVAVIINTHRPLRRIVRRRDECIYTIKITVIIRSARRSVIAHIAVVEHSECAAIPRPFCSHPVRVRAEANIIQLLPFVIMQVVLYCEVGKITDEVRQDKTLLNQANIHLKKVRQ